MVAFYGQITSLLREIEVTEPMRQIWWFWNWSYSCEYVL